MKKTGSLFCQDQVGIVRVPLGRYPIEETCNFHCRSWFYSDVLEGSSMSKESSLKTPMNNQSGLDDFYLSECPAEEK